VSARQPGCHFYFARRVTFLSCADRSSRFLTPAIAPLRAKTKVPTRSSTSRGVSIVGSPTRNRTTRRSSPRPVLIGRMVRPMAPARRTPRRSTPRRRSARSDGCGRKARIVVGRDFVEPVCLLGFRVAVGVGAADEPRHGGRVPFRAERSEILAGWRRSGLAYSAGGTRRRRASAPLRKCRSWPNSRE